jgi:protein-tyrosine phosphatase
MATPTFRPGQSIPISTVPNLRDLGGWPTPDGKVREGLLFRSAEFADLQGGDASAFGQLGIRAVYDMRTEDERAAEPNRVPAGTEYVVVDILRDSSGAAPSQLLKVFGDPKAAEELLGGGKAVALFINGYREIVSLPSALSGYRQFFTDIAQPEHRPALFHCTTGKDRTGWAAASLLLLLGVSEEDVFADYLLTNQQLLPALQPKIDQFESIGGDPELLVPILGVQRTYLEAAIVEMTKRYGSIEGYFSEGLRLDAPAIDGLRETFVEARADVRLGDNDDQDRQ